MEQYRIFISYSHDNRQDAGIIADILRENGLSPFYDANLPPGRPFDDLIATYISHSHVFMPLITNESAQRGWVHQEIGYAMAMHIPVLPVSVDNLPPAMIQRLHAVTLDDDLDMAREKLTYEVFQSLVENCVPDDAVYLCREQSEERAMMMARLADDVRTIGTTGFLRQRGGLSSFQIPDKPASHRVWTERYDPYLKNEFHCKCQMAERKALQAHARAKGCRLVINPYLIRCPRYSSTAQRARLGTFLEFLRGMPPDKADVVIDRDMDFNESVTILGDWFSAESYYRPETGGFMQTMFTTYAPGIKTKIETFDSEFETLLSENGIRTGGSLPAAISLIETMIEEIRVQ